MPILGHQVKCSALLIFIAKQLSEEIWHLHSAFLGTHPACRKWQIVWLLIYRGKKTPRCWGNWLPHTCPRWLWIPWCWELDLSILAAVPSETQALGQHAALIWMTKRSFHISRHIWWRKDGREGILQLMALPWTECQRAKDSHNCRKTWLLTLITIFRLFYIVFSAPKVVSFKDANNTCIFISCKVESRNGSFWLSSKWHQSKTFKL